MARRRRPPIVAAQSPIETTALAKVDDRGGALVAKVIGEIATKEMHNFTGDKMDVFRMISKACGPLCKHFVDAANKDIKLDQFYVHKVQMWDRETGEEFEATRTVLFDVDGEGYAFVSDGVAKDLARIVNTFGMGPYNGSIVLRVVPVKTGGGFQTYTLVAV